MSPEPVRKGEAVKGRMAVSMLELIQRQGYAGTGLNAVLEHAGAPKGSLYFHFPGGKEQLGVQAIGLAAEQFTALIRECLTTDPATELADAIESAIDALAALMVASDYTLGCPVSVVTLEMGNASDALRAACTDAYDAWVALVEEFLVARQVPAAEAKVLGSAAVSLIEGALIISRARRSPQPLRDAGASLRTLAGSAVRGTPEESR
ncbi:TetR/AcrR family transcriptional regulator [Kribbella hippodromi]|uniref:TetR/AcrR family transcriptional regulator n=1 Tax=Kribbella hippodromi TaxID=434347 RepID=A0ABN2E0S2_9ACTN